MFHYFFSSLTPKEKQVYLLLIDGKSPKQIAFRLKVSIPAIKHHLSSLYKKSGKSTALQLVVWHYKELLDHI